MIVAPVVRLWRFAAGVFCALSHICRAPRPIARAVPHPRGWHPWLSLTPCTPVQGCASGGLSEAYGIIATDLLQELSPEGTSHW